jgi:hypothetical protein
MGPPIGREAVQLAMSLCSATSSGGGATCGRATPGSPKAGGRSPVWADLPCRSAVDDLLADDFK